MEKNILHLTLKREWFQMIASGEKKEEYREIKKYWGTRLLNKIATPHGGYFSPWADIEKGDYEFKGWSEFVSSTSIFANYDIIRFRNGYATDAPTFDIECKGIEMGRGKQQWGAESGKDYFIIKLGKVLIPETLK